MFTSLSHALLTLAKAIQNESARAIASDVAQEAAAQQQGRLMQEQTAAVRKALETQQALLVQNERALELAESWRRVEREHMAVCAKRYEALLRGEASSMGEAKVVKH